MPDLYLGIDTSNYKTSIAVVDASGNEVFAISEFLEVEKGSRGLRQSEAFFRHSCRLPSYIEKMCQSIDPSDICAAGVSSRPRRLEGSYMPCFLSGVNAAKEMTSVLGIPLHEFSHQEGHAAAVIEDGSGSIPDKSALFHLSGGTTEMLLCSSDDKGYDLEITGGTLDISFGQLIDRLGVAMGYPFPAGQYLDSLAEEYVSDGMVSQGKAGLLLPKPKISDGHFNLSGIETKALRYIEENGNASYSETAYNVFMLTADIMYSSAVRMKDVYDTDIIFMAGGVSSSSFIRHRIEELSADAGRRLDIRFGAPELSGDNAVGTARLARRIHSLYTDKTQ